MKTVVVTSFDANYLQYSYVFVKTLSENYHGSTVLDLYCLVPEDVLGMENIFVENLGDVSNLNIKFICSDKFSKFSANERVSGSEWISKNAWHRIFIPSLCKDFDRVVYIDSDTMIMRDVSPLINFNLTNKFAAFIENNFNSAERVFEDQDRVYFNAGVFVADLNYWRSLGLEEKMINDVLLHGVTLMLEQDRLNIAFNDVVITFKIKLSNTKFAALIPIGAPTINGGVFVIKSDIYKMDGKCNTNYRYQLIDFFNRKKLLFNILHKQFCCRQLLLSKVY
jgi:lipopolysaccharide biosynthesis glycosyltransferase